MASANQRKATFISHKLTFLKDQGDHLISSIGDYVNRTSHSKTAATSTPATSDRQSAAPLASTATTSYRQPAAPLASTATTSYRQSAAPLASTATTSYRQSAESVQPADDTQLKQVFAKIAVIGETVYSFRSRTEKVAEKQSDIDKQLKELSSKLSELDKKHSSRFKKVKQEISEIRETQDAIEQEQKTRFRCLDKQLQKISTVQNRQKEEMESQAELLEKLVHVPNLLESVKENVDSLHDRIDEIIDDTSNKYKDLATEMRDQSDKVKANTQSVQLTSDGQDQNTTLLRELETRLQTLEADGGRNVKGVQKQAEKGEANFQIVCQMLNDRLRPLEQLRTCLNERASMRDDNVTKLSQLIQEVAAMSPRLQQLEMKSAGTRCGFSAVARLAGEVADMGIIREYEIQCCNVGENFNADGGIFTAPVDGLYVASLSLCLLMRDHLRIGVEYKQSLDQESSTEVCASSVATKHTTVCGVGVIDMKAGEVLFSRVILMEESDYDKMVHFSCFLLG